MVYQPELDLTEQEELLLEYTDLVNKMIDVRSELDRFLKKHEIHAMRAEVMIESEDKVKEICEHADCIMALMSAIDESEKPPGLFDILEEEVLTDDF